MTDQAILEAVKQDAHAMNELALSERPQGHPVETAGDAVIGSANDIRQFRRRRASAQATAMCGAVSVPDFLTAVAWYQDALDQISREGRCLECGLLLIGNETTCARCGRENG